MEDPYDHEKVSEEFKQLAELAGALYRANVDSAAQGPGSARAHDELLARLSLYGYLYDRHFLQTRELLLAELRWLLATRRPVAPGQAMDIGVFDEHRNTLLRMLISRFQFIAPDVVDDALMRTISPRISSELRLTGVPRHRSAPR
jgi:hypothetical protein